MEEFLHRRYCRFVNRKKNKSKMNNNNADEGVNFKVRRFLQDVDKFNKKTKKKKVRKEAKERNISLPKNKGIYKNAILSFPGIKALNCSNNARLKGDLIALTIKPNEGNGPKICENSIVKEIENQRKTTGEVNKIPEKNSEAITLSSSKLLQIQEGISEKELVLNDNTVDNAVTRADIEKTVGGSENSGHYKSVKKNDLVQENKENHCCFSKLKNGLTETFIEKQEDNCNQCFDLFHNNMEGIFDFFKTPEREVISKFASISKNCFENPTPTWESFNEDNFPKKVNSDSWYRQPNSVTLLPNEYIFKNISENRDIQNISLLFSEVENNYIKYVHPAESKFLTKKENPNHNAMQSNYDNHKFCVDHLNPLKLFNSNTKFNKIFSEIPSENLEKLNNSPPIFKKKESALLNIAESHKNPIYFADHYTKSDKKRTKWKTKYIKSNLKKCLFQEKFKNQPLFEETMKSKKELFNLTVPLLNCNRRFKNNLKFSPHKYC